MLQLKRFVTICRLHYGGCIVQTIAPFVRMPQSALGWTAWALLLKRLTKPAKLNPSSKTPVPIAGRYRCRYAKRRVATCYRMWSGTELCPWRFLKRVRVSMKRCFVQIQSFPSTGQSRLYIRTWGLASPSGVVRGGGRSKSLVPPNVGLLRLAVSWGPLIITEQITVSAHWD